MSKLLITGGSGFIGSALVRNAIKAGNKVCNIDALTYSGRIENNASVASCPNYTFIKENICNQEQLSKIFHDFQPDFIYHLAAESHVDRSIENAKTFIDTNIIGTYNLLEVSLEYWKSNSRDNKFRFLQVSTDEVYGSNTELGGFTEERKYNPSNPYSASKAAADHLATAWFKTYGLPVIITNTSNNFGPFQYPEKLIPIIIISALTGQKIPIYGSGENIRDWIYVEEHAEALLNVACRGNVGARYNIGATNEKGNIELAKSICNILDELVPKSRPYAEQICFVTDRPGHDQRYSIDATKIKKELGWSSKISFDSALRKTVEWYLQNESWWRPMSETRRKEIK